MRHYPDGLTKRILSALLLLVGIAVGARVVYGLLVPLLPGVIAIVALSAIYLMIFGRRRRY